MKSLFQSVSQPVVSEEEPGDMPEAGPNAVEVGVLQYDPDSNILVLSMRDVQGAYRLEDMPPEGSAVTLLLRDSKLGPRVEIRVIPRTPMPKFASAEEADAWLDANT